MSPDEEVLLKNLLYMLDTPDIEQLLAKMQDPGCHCSACKTIRKVCL